MTRKAPVLLALLVLFPTVEVWADDVTPPLKHNPFNQPDLIAEQAAKTDKQQVSNWSGLLQATLVSGEHSLANVDGQLIGIGEDYEGYQLLEVGEGTATFTKLGVVITVQVGSDGDGEDGV